MVSDEEGWRRSWGGRTETKRASCRAMLARIWFSGLLPMLYHYIADINMDENVDNLTGTLLEVELSIRMVIDL